MRISDWSSDVCSSDLALQIRELLEDEIQRKAILDDRLGTEEEICARLGTSRHVLRQAIRVLESQGVVESQRGRSRGLVAGTPKIAAAEIGSASCRARVCP